MSTKAIALVTCTECKGKFGTLVGTEKTQCPLCGKHLTLFPAVEGNENSMPTREENAKRLMEESHEE